MNFPAIGVVVPFISTRGHPRDEATIHKDIWISIYPLYSHNIPKLGFYSFNSSIPPTLSSPQPVQPKECAPFTAHHPSSCIVCLSRLLVQLVFQESLSWGIQELSDASGFLTTFTRLLNHFLNTKSHYNFIACFTRTHASFPT
jgi:hypothetical protein